MTCAELIAELQQHPPHKEVRIYIPEVFAPGSEDETVLDAEIDDVRNEGPFILVRGR